MIESLKDEKNVVGVEDEKKEEEKEENNKIISSIISTQNHLGIKSKEEFDKFFYKIDKINKNNNKITLFNTSKLGNFVLLYGYYICKNPKNVEYLMESGLSLFTWIPYNNRKRLRLLTLGIGHHTIDYMYRDTLYIINIDVFSEGDVSGQGEKTLFVNRIELSIENSENNRNFGDNHNIVIKFIENSKTMMEAILEKFKTPSSVTRLIYDKGYW